jgi:hypothetical protein
MLQMLMSQTSTSLFPWKSSRIGGPHSIFHGLKKSKPCFLALRCFISNIFRATLVTLNSEAVMAGRMPTTADVLTVNANHHYGCIDNFTVVRLWDHSESCTGNLLRRLLLDEDNLFPIHRLRACRRCTSIPNQLRVVSSQRTTRSCPGENVPNQH